MVFFGELTQPTINAAWRCWGLMPSKSTLTNEIQESEGARCNFLIPWWSSSDMWPAGFLRRALEMSSGGSAKQNS